MNGPPDYNDDSMGNHNSPAPPGFVSELRTSDTIGKIAEALAKAQAEMENPEKNRDVKVRGKSKGGGVVEYTFKYATIDSVFNAIRPALSNNCIAYIQPIVETAKGTAVITRLIHGDSGEWLESIVLVGGREGMQSLGSAVTYIKRYAICAICGIASEDDDDANVSEGQQIAAKDGNDLWGGPLNKTKFKEVMRAFVTDIDACGDTASLAGLLNHKDSIDLMEQCRRDTPAWWYGQEGSDVLGLDTRINERRSKLETLEARGLDDDQPTILDAG